MKEEIKIDDAKYITEIPGKYKNKKKYTYKPTNDVKAFIPGLIHDIYAKPGQTVKAGTALISLEAMKMFNDISVNFDIVVQSVTVKKNDIVEKNQILLTFTKISLPYTEAVD